MGITRRKFIKAGLWLTAGGLLLDAWWIERFFIETNEYYIGNAGKDRVNIKAVQLSDLHLQSIGFRLKRLAKKLNGLKPDLILLTGDAIDKAQNLPLLDDFLSLLDKRIQKVAITGNWEYWGNVNIEELANVYASHNGVLLINRCEQFTFRGKSISITGTDDFVGDQADIKEALKNYISCDHHIVLNHCPQYSDQIASFIATQIPVDMILSGHTHGGQINIFGFIPFLPQGSGKYIKGWYTAHGSRIYVSKGIGTSIIPARFGARAEIAIFNL